MLIDRTYQDYLSLPESERVDFIRKCIALYKGSAFYTYAVTAQTYFDGENEAIMTMPALEIQRKDGAAIKLQLARIPSNIFKRNVMQLCNFELSEGINVDNAPIDSILGDNTDRKVLDGAMKAFVHGVSYAFVTGKEIRKIFDALHMFTLDDEWTSEPKIAVRFWQIKNASGVVDYFQIYDEQGVESYSCKSDSTPVLLFGGKQPYISIQRVDEATGAQTIGTRSIGALPIVPLWVNDDHVSELRPNIKEKIDWYDIIFSSNSVFTQQMAKIYWTINSTMGGNPEDIKTMVDELTHLGIAVNEEGGLNAKPEVMPSNVADRQATLKMIEDDIYKDFMALNFDTITGGSLTNVAINTASAMLRMRANDLYYYASVFIKKCLDLCGIPYESISMKEASISNDLETVQMIYMSRADLTLTKALQLNPMIESDEVDQLVKDLEAEQTANLPSMEELQAEIDGMKNNQNQPQAQPTEDNAE